jgi:hypothetical protein
MSIQAVAWALEQDFSYTTPKGRQTSAHGAKLVLISLANHADHTSGHCWPSSETIARESSCNVRSVYRLIAALERNGFIDVKRVRGGSGKQRSNNYWIRFDRTPSSWQFFEDEEDDQSDTVSRDSEVETEAESATESPGQSDIGVTPYITLEPSVVEPSAREAPPPAPPVPVRFDNRKREIERQKAADEERRPKRVFVIEGTRAWKAWDAHRRAELKAQGDSRWKMISSPIPTTWHEGKCGWHFPTLFPDSTGPPDPTLLTPEDDQFIQKQVG